PAEARRVIMYMPWDISSQRVDSCGQLRCVDRLGASVTRELKRAPRCVQFSFPRSYKWSKDGRVYLPLGGADGEEVALAMRESTDPIMGEIRPHPKRDRCNGQQQRRHREDIEGPIGDAVHG